MKKVLLVLTVILLAVSLCACAEITYTSSVSEGGARVFTTSIKLDKTAMTTTAYNQLCTEIANILSTQKAARESEGRTVTVEANAETGVFVLTESFSSNTDYYIAYGITGNEPSEPNKIYSQSAFFVDYYIENSVISSSTLENYTQIFSKYVNTDDPYGEVSLDYVYSTEYNNVSALNADESYSKDGYNYMVWHIDLNDPDSEVLKYVSRTPKVWLFELLGIVIGCVTVGVLIAVGIIINKHNRKKGGKKEEEEVLPFSDLTDIV